jgi:F-type H+-transporting ATPase subunit delta
MDETLTKDAKNLVDGVVSYLKDDSRSKSVVPKVEKLLGKVTAQARKEKIAKVETGVPLTETEKKNLETLLTRSIGHEVTVLTVVTPEVIGGLRIQVADWIVDTTIQTQIEQMARSLTL